MITTKQTTKQNKTNKQTNKQTQTNKQSCSWVARGGAFGRAFRTRRRHALLHEKVLAEEYRLQQRKHNQAKDTQHTHKHNVSVSAATAMTGRRTCRGLAREACASRGAKAPKQARLRREGDSICSSCVLRFCLFARRFLHRLRRENLSGIFTLHFIVALNHLICLKVIDAWLESRGEAETLKTEGFIECGFPSVWSPFGSDGWHLGAPPRAGKGGRPRRKRRCSGADAASGAVSNWEFAAVLSGECRRAPTRGDVSVKPTNSGVGERRFFAPAVPSSVSVLPTT